MELKKLLEIIKNKWLRDTILTILIIATVILIYMALNLGFQILDITDIDLTKEKYYSISEETKKQLNGIDKPINIYMFGYNENSSPVDLVKQYSKYKENINVEVVSINDRPDLAEKYSVTSTDEQYQTIVFECEGRTVKANSYDFLTQDYNTGDYIDLTEQKITNSILGVILENAPKIYLLEGHSEYSKNDYLMPLVAELESAVNEVKTLNLLVSEKVPEDCQTLIISNPSTDFTNLETNLIIEYVKNGGNIMWMSDYSKNGILKNAQKILDLYGITVHNDGIVAEQDKNAILIQQPDIILPQINEEAEITNPFAKTGKVVFIDSGKIITEKEEKLTELGVEITPLLMTSDKAFYRTDLTQKSTSPVKGEEEGQLLLGAIASKTIEKEDGTITSNLVVYANNLFATDYPLTISNQYVSSVYLGNNMDLLLNSISYLTERTDTITIRKAYSSTAYTPTAAEDLVVRIIIFVVPLLIIVAGIVIWILRKRRKTRA